MFATVVALSVLGQVQTVPSAPREFRAVWIATVANIDWPSRPGLPVAQMRSELQAMVDRAADLNLNAIIFQIRPTADSLFQSDIEPWSYFLTGEQGRAPEGGFDPLREIIAMAHAQGIEVHAWFNPYRSRHPAQTGPAAPSHISRTRPDVNKTYGTFEWMDPGEQYVQDRSFNVFMDVARRYNVDGIHIDDYFYPYPIQDAEGRHVEFPDEPSWQRYVAGGGTLSRDDWRRQNVNQFVERVYTNLKRERPWVQFGISPFGIYRPGYPPVVRAAFDQYAQLYADARLWLHEGWMDYWTPQLYWRIDSPQPFRPLLEWWVQNNARERHIWPGAFTSRMSPDLNNWPAEEIVNQIQITRETPGASGLVHFSMRALMNDWGGINEALKTGPYREMALIPPSPWLGNDNLTAPTGVSASYHEGTRTLRARWTSPNQARTKFYAVYVRERGLWRLVSVGSETSASVEGIDRPEEVAVSTIDRFNNEGPFGRVRM